LGVGRLAALDTGLPIFLQAGLVMLGATLGDIGAELNHQWRYYMVRKLYIEDIVDGLCLDRGTAINEPNAWRWYRQRGAPWRIDPNRERPRVRVVVALARLEDIKRAFRD
jgi:hypothetical protein